MDPKRIADIVMSFAFGVMVVCLVGFAVLSSCKDGSTKGPAPSMQTIDGDFAPAVFRDEVHHVTCYRAMNRNTVGDGISCVADPATSCSGVPR